MTKATTLSTLLDSREAKLLKVSSKHSSVTGNANPFRPELLRSYVQQTMVQYVVVANTYIASY